MSHALKLTGTFTFASVFVVASLLAAPNAEAQDPLPPPPVPEEQEDTVPEDTLPRDTMPEDTMPEDTMPEDTMPEDTMPADPGLPMEDPDMDDMDMDADADIVDTAAGDDRFTHLVEGLRAAGLEQTLRGPGPFTVFAPTDQAHDQLPPGAMEELRGDQQEYSDVLAYHVVEGRLTSEDLAGMTSVTTVQGETLPVRAEGGQVMIGDATVIEADIDAENGVIHVIDAVLLPGAQDDPMQDDDPMVDMDDDPMMDDDQDPLTVDPREEEPEMVRKP